MIIDLLAKEKIKNTLAFLFSPVIGTLPEFKSPYRQYMGVIL